MTAIHYLIALQRTCAAENKHFNALESAIQYTKGAYAGTAQVYGLLNTELKGIIKHFEDEQLEADKESS